ncbi:MAG: phosphoribosylamine--glycine ligase [Acidobacteria bacterium]|nr:MAG: phosphoribosylamine--glycine ligase [Acidobacteriota bacterium]
MKVLVVGSGGREHALCWKLRQSPHLTELYCAPGNPGIAEVADLVPIADDEIHQLADFAADLKIDLTVVGPELPLTLGLADELIGRGVAVFGPRQQAAELEGSKVFAKEFMRRHGIPTARFEIAHDAAEARAAAQRLGFPVVLKADGLAAGKGVLIPGDEAELEAALATFFDERRFGSAGDRVVVERCLSGEEVSFLALCDGEHLLPLPPCKDYKRLEDDDRGPNTGGMGAHSPSAVLSSGVGASIIERIMKPAVAGMAAENRPFAGVLYAGLMLTSEGPQVLEFNVRFGDPEAQPLLMRLEDDLLPVLVQGAQGRFETPRLRIRKAAAACVVLASRGYPQKPVKGEPIQGLEAARAHPGVEVFHAGTARAGAQLITAGGRVLGVCASGVQLLDALRRAYVAAAEIHWPSKILRRDVGRRVLERATGGSRA